MLNVDEKAKLSFMISQLGSGGQVICFEDLHDDVTFHFFGFPKMPLMILGSVDDGGQPHCESENENLTIEWLEAEKYENPAGRALLERDPSFFSLGKACGKTITRRPMDAVHAMLPTTHWFNLALQSILS